MGNRPHSDGLLPMCGPLAPDSVGSVAPVLSAIGLTKRFESVPCSRPPICIRGARDTIICGFSPPLLRAVEPSGRGTGAGGPEGRRGRAKGYCAPRVMSGRWPGTTASSWAARCTWAAGTTTRGASCPNIATSSPPCPWPCSFDHAGRRAARWPRDRSDRGCASSGGARGAPRSGAGLRSVLDRRFHAADQMAAPAAGGGFGPCPPTSLHTAAAI